MKATVKSTTKPKAASLTKGDFDKATAHAWDAETCLVAQFMIRNGIPVLSSMSAYNFAFHHGLRSIQIKFDTAFTYPRDKRKASLKKLRASLPIKIRLS